MLIQLKRHSAVQRLHQQYIHHRQGCGGDGGGSHGRGGGSLQRMMIWHRRIMLLVVVCLLCFDVVWNNGSSRRRVQDSIGQRKDEFVNNAFLHRFLISNDSFAALPTGSDISNTARTTTVPMTTYKNSTLQQILVTDCWNSVDIQNKTKNPLKLLEVPKTDAVYYHIGKTGGGSVIGRIKAWKLRVRSCHPNPPTDLQFRHDILMHKPVVLVGIRDPIDRLISAYNWRSLIVCKPNNETRSIGPATFSPNQYCKESKSSSETAALFTKYTDFNDLAENTCYVDGQNDLQAIQHAHLTIEDWLSVNPVTTSSNTNSNSTGRSKSLIAPFDRIMPLVVEPGYDLKLQVDSAMMMLHNTTQFEDTETFTNRLFGVRDRDCKSEHKLKRQQQQQQQQQRKVSAKTKSTVMSAGKGNFSNNTAVIRGYKHSSIDNGKRIPVLSTKAVHCLSKYYSNDYILLRNLMVQSCRTDECRNAIKSILQRRSSQKH